MNRTIKDHLAALFSSLVYGSGDEPTAQTGSFQAVSYFAYPATANDAVDLDLVSLPIALRLPTEIEFDPPSFGSPDYVQHMADFINDWLSANGLSAAARPALWQRSELRFDISLFTDLSKTGRPILRMRNLFLGCKNISS